MVLICPVIRMHGSEVESYNGTDPDTLKSIDILLGMGKTLSPKSKKRLGTIRSLFEQQKYMFDHHTDIVGNPIVSLSQTFLWPIFRRKIKDSVEFGAKLDISICAGFTRLEKQSFEAYNESTTLKDVIERYLDRTEKYPGESLRTRSTGITTIWPSASE